MVVAGTVSYCAPELLKEGKLTKAADVYSFAMMMWEICTGTMLFRGMNSSQVLATPPHGHRASALSQLMAVRAQIHKRLEEQLTHVRKMNHSCRPVIQYG